MSKVQKIGIALGTASILLMAAFYVFVVVANQQKGRPSTVELLTIALGTYRSNYVWSEWDVPKPPADLKRPSCSASSWNTKTVMHDVPYENCVMPYEWEFGPGCSWWRLEDCDEYHVDDFVLSQPLAWGRIVHALAEPCAYLPSPEFMARGGPRDGNIADYFKKSSCDLGGVPYPKKVVINVVNDSGKVVARYIHDPPNK